MTTKPPRVTIANMQHTVFSPGDVRMDRVGVFGNPFTIPRDGDREIVVAKHREWLKDHMELVAALIELDPKRLLCWCAPLPCHCDNYADALEGKL